MAEKKKADKPKLPASMISELFWDELYFGDDAAQAAAVKTMVDKASQAPGGIYVITGPVRTGKGTTFEEFTRLMKAKQKVHVMDNMDFWIDQVPSPDPTVHNIFRMHEDREVKELPEMLKDARAYIKAHPNTSVVLDTLNHVPMFPYMATPDKKKAQVDQEKFIERMASENPDITIVRTAHDLGQVKQALWDVNEQLREDYSETGKGFHHDIFYSQKHPDLKKLCDALDAGSQKKFDQAFDRIQQQCGTGLAGGGG